MVSQPTKLPFGDISSKILKFLKTRNTATLNQIHSATKLSIKKIVNSLSILIYNRQIKYYIFNGKTFYILNSCEYVGWVFNDFYVKYILKIVDFNRDFYKESGDIEMYLGVVVKLVCSVGVSCDGLSSKEECFFDSLVLYGFVKSVSLEEIIDICKYNTNIDKEGGVNNKGSSYKGVNRVDSYKGVNRVDSYKGVSNSIDNYKGVNDRTNSIKGVNRVDSYKGVSNSIDNYKGVSNSIDNYKGVSNSIDNYKGVSERINSIKGVSDRTNSIKGVSNSIDTYKGGNTTIDKQHPVNNLFNNYKGVNDYDPPLNIDKISSKRLKGVKYYTLDLQALNHSILIYEGCKYIQKKYCKITRDVFSCIERSRGGTVSTLKGILPYNLIDIEIAVLLLKGVNILIENKGINKEGYVVNKGVLKHLIKMDILKGVIYNTSVIDGTISDITFEGVSDIDVVKGGVIRVLNMIVDKGVLEDSSVVRSSLLSSKVLRVVQCILLKIGMINLGVKDVIGKACYVWEECFDKGCYIIGNELSDNREKLILMI
ncbi:hypothetical protein CWI36_1653p0010 [Hamiltosporidium magnivora]|uniref:RNA polymerase III subunit RPC82-related helix-turn-helix domain-containing protein n=1 Tax=Hamiltosporidium magnivora TaxID=148818 RepID=A0A4Q9KZD5_9MICR|nr:hypothetical protein CWI36_1653p0010 [Hamiltosporidium magnivora]